MEPHILSFCVPIAPSRNQQCAHCDISEILLKAQGVCLFSTAHISKLTLYIQIYVHTLLPIYKYIYKIIFK